MYVHLHLNPVRPTFLLQEKHRLGFFCTGGLGLGGWSGGALAAAVAELEAVSNMEDAGLGRCRGEMASGEATGEDPRCRGAAGVTIGVGSAIMGVGSD